MWNHLRTCEIMEVLKPGSADVKVGVQGMFG